MALEIQNYQVGFLKNICFISSMLFHNFLLLMLRNLPQSICILFSSRKFCFYLLLMWAGMWAIICLKETDSVQFFLFTFMCCQNLEELKLENQWTKISISQIKITFSENIVNFFKSENIRSGKLKLFWGIEAPFVK